MKTASIKRLERMIEGHSYTVFEVGVDISEILDVTNTSEQGHVYPEYYVNYRNGVRVDLIGGIFTVTRYAIGD